MKSEIKIEDTIIRGAHPTPGGSRRSLRKIVLSPMVCSICASFGIFGGISALFTGLICVVIHAAIPRDAVFDRVGTILLVAAIPMILLGSVFLDEIGVRK